MTWSYTGPPRKSFPYTLPEGWTKEQFFQGWVIPEDYEYTKNNREEIVEVSDDGKYYIESRWCNTSCCRIVTLYVLPEKKLIDAELTDGLSLSAECILEGRTAAKETRMKNVIAMKLRGVWVQAELTWEGAVGVLKHDLAFEGFVAIVDGELKRYDKPKSDELKTPDDAESSPSTELND